MWKPQPHLYHYPRVHNRGILLSVFSSIFPLQLFYLFILSIGRSSRVITPPHSHCQRCNHRSQCLIQSSLLLPLYTVSSELYVYIHIPLIASACPIHWVISTIMHCDIYLWARMLCSAQCGQPCQQEVLNIEEEISNISKHGFFFRGVFWLSGLFHHHLEDGDEF